jgi:hypothetical protein
MYSHRKQVLRSVCSLIALTTAVLSAETSAMEPTLTVRGHEFMGRDVHYSTLFWASLTATDENGAYVTGLTLDDFIITESIVERAGGAVVAGPVTVDVMSQIGDVNERAGFWEKSVSDVKMDVVFLVDQTGTMSEETAEIVAQIRLFADRLVASHVDFRIAGVKVTETPDWYDHFPFRSRLEVDRLDNDLDTFFDTGTEWWSPSTMYDALLWTPWLEFRDDARKVVVMVTDIIPQNVYGAFWYAGGSSAVTPSAVELFLEETGIEVYYSLNPDEDVNLDGYADDFYNPLATDVGGGFAYLENKGLITGLRSAPGAAPWPFLQQHIPVEVHPLMDSRYVLSWGSDFTWDDVPGASGAADDYWVQVTARATLPAKAGETVTATFSYPLSKEEVQLDVVARDEQGNPLLDQVAYNVLFPIGLEGDRLEHYSWHVWVEDDVMRTNVDVGTYVLNFRDEGWHSFAYNTIRANHSQWVTVPAEGLVLDATIPMGDRTMELAKLRGLLQDLRTWEISGKPFREVALEAEAWVDGLDANGMTWEDMAALKRLYMALSGYANMSAYAKIETDKAIDDFHIIVNDIRSIVAQIEALGNETPPMWQEALSLVLEVAYDILTKGQFTVKKEVVEQGLDKLLDYAQNEVVDELKKEVINKLPEGPFKGLLTAMVQMLVERNFTDFTPVIEAAKQLGIQGALDSTTKYVTDGFTDEVFGNLDLPGPVEENIADLAVEVVRGIIGEQFDQYGDGFDNFDETMATFAENLVKDLGADLFNENREDIVAKVDDVFQRIQDNVPEEMPAVVSDFLIGVAKDFAVEAARTVNVETFKCNIDNDRMIGILIKHGLYHVVLKHYYVDEARNGMEQALDRAGAWEPFGHRYNWQAAMNWDFHEYRQLAGDMQGEAWNALRTQEAIDAWANSLQTLVNILDPLAEALDFLAILLPSIEPVAEKVHEFIIVLDGVQVLSKAIEFGLELHCLDTFGNQATRMYEAALPGFEHWKPAITVYATDPEATEGDEADPAQFTFLRTGDSSRDVVINYTLGGTAKNMYDYYALSGSFVLYAGEISGVVTLSAHEDKLYEPQEIVVLMLEEGGYVAGFPYIAAVAIADSGAPGIAVAVADVTAVENDASNTAAFTFSRLGDSAEAVTVNYRITGTALNGVDYAALSGAVTIAAGAASAGVLVTPVNDSEYEGRETVVLSLGEGDYALSEPTSATVYIGDSDLMVVSIAATDAEAAETGSDAASFTVTREGDTAAELTVALSIAGTAGNGYDYETIHQSVTIPEGAETATITVTPIADEEQEGDETVVVTLQPLSSIPSDPAQDYVIGLPDTATAIIGDGGSTQVSVAVADDTAFEQGGDAAAFLLTRTDDKMDELEVQYVLDGTAENGADYETLPGTAVIAAGEASALVEISPLTDGEAEGSETVRLTLSAGDGYAVGDMDNGVAVIVDANASPDSLYVGDGNDILGGGTADAPWASIGFAMRQAGHYASETNPLVIHVAEGTYEEQVIFAPYVTLSGAGVGETIIQHYNALDETHVVVVGAEAAALQGCTVSLADDYPETAVLLQIDNISMRVENVRFDGNGASACTAIDIAGPSSSGSMVRNCEIREVDAGIWAENSGLTITGTIFDYIASYGVLVLPTIVKNATAPTMGILTDEGVQGMNQFHYVMGHFIKNLSATTVQAHYNDWGLYTRAEIMRQLSGPVLLDTFLGAHVDEDRLFITLVDDATDAPILADALPELTVNAGGVTATYDEEGGLYAIMYPEGMLTYEASATGYAPLTVTREAPVDECRIEVLRLQPLATEGEGEEESEGEGEPAEGEGEEESEGEGEPAEGEGEEESEGEGEPAEGEGETTAEGETKTFGCSGGTITNEVSGGSPRGDSLLLVFVGTMLLLLSRRRRVSEAD